ncbi:phytoene desaturase family protein [Aquihabitans sp. McL0605]|uniref:phytoene desaturase family protein n=1 Tax=Aquihabitans sp. McL0605 TaxID=3415671 RepID=UPI003CFBAA7D
MSVGTEPVDADAIVIGAGPNGLVAANLLADAGWSVVVLEAGDEPGGSVRSAELIEPGFLNDVCSAFYPLATEGSPIDDLHLSDHGLRWLHAPTVLAHPALDGSCPVISRDIDVTMASLDALHPGDGASWEALVQRWTDLQPHLSHLLYRPFPPVAAAAGLVRHLPPRDLARLGRFLMLPARRMGEEELGGSASRRLLAGCALHADLTPESTLSGFFGWLMCCLGQTNGFPVPEGGARAVTSALVARLESRGGQVHCAAAVDRVEVHRGRAVGVHLTGAGTVRAGRAVLADVNAPMLYTSLVGAGDLPDAVLGDIERFHWDDATFKVDWTLDGPIPWSSAEARGAGTVHVAEDTDALTVVASELARGLLPARPFLLIGQQSMTDPSRQPAGKETAWAYTHVPRRVRGDGAGVLGRDWSDDDVGGFVARIEAQVEALAPGFQHLIRGRHVLTPERFEAENPNLSSGAINGGTAQLHQQLVFRPVPGLGRAVTPIGGLYLASSSAHPGGGLHGAPGANAARAAIWHDRTRPWRRRGAHP